MILQQCHHCIIWDDDANEKFVEESSLRRLCNLMTHSLEAVVDAPFESALLIEDAASTAASVVCGWLAAAACAAPDLELLCLDARLAEAKGDLDSGMLLLLLLLLLVWLLRADKLDNKD